MELLISLKQKAIQLQRKIVYPESNDPRILEAACQVQQAHIAIPVLIGKQEEVIQLAQKSNVAIQGIDIIDPTAHSEFNDFVTTYYEMRKTKGVTVEQAQEIMQQPIFFATMMVKKDMAHGMISGSLTPTSDTLRPAFQIIGTKEGVKKASGLFLMIKVEEKELLFFADSAVNIDPTVEELAGIAISTADSAKNFGIEPRIAMLSFSTYGSASHPFVDKVKQARELVNKLRPDLVIGGEMQFDAAFVKEVAQLKCPQSPIQGDANVFIFPNLECGNIGYKITQRLGKYQAIGPILQGLKKPVNDLSRGCSVQDIVDMTVITVNQ